MKPISCPVRMSEKEVKGTIERIAANIELRELAEGPTTYRCPECLDRGYVQGKPFHRGNLLYETVKPCSGCYLGQRIEERIRQDQDPR